MRAADLSGNHLGAKITVNDNNRVAASGTLQAVNHEADLVSERPMFSPHDWYSLGSTRVTITLVPGSILHVRPDAEVELLDQ